MHKLSGNAKLAKKQWETTSYNNVNSQLVNTKERVFKGLLNFQKQGSTINNRNSLTNTSQKILLYLPTGSIKYSRTVPVLSRVLLEAPK